MKSKEAVIDEIKRAFAGNAFPGEQYLQGSTEGCEPYEEVGPFGDKHDWQQIDAEFLDAHAGALCFFSETGFRYFLPSFLIADLREQLQYADPLFHLTNGFRDITVTIEKPNRVFEIISGKSALINPRRYGAMTTHDYLRYRLSVFTREEAQAIVAYLQYKRAVDQDGYDTPAIDAALNSFWLERAQSAPTAADLQRYLAEQEAYLAEIHAERNGNADTR